MAGRLVLLVGSPRIAPGLLTREAWRTLEGAATVACRDAEESLPAAIADAGLVVVETGPLGVPELARELVGRAAEQELVWIGSADADPGLTDAIAAEVSRLERPPEVEILLASWDVPGSRLLDVVAVMDRLRSPGGCPWDAEQTHQSLVTYLIEEAHEAAEAIESGDRGHMVEELGDVLLQVAFQSRVGQEDPRAPFDIDDVAGAIVEKLVRRHPHVFADGEASTPSEVETAWEAIKAQEKGSREGGLAAGIPASLASLARAEKVLTRHRRAGWDPTDPDALGLGPGLGDRVLVLVAEGLAAGESADQAARAALRRLEERLSAE